MTVTVRPYRDSDYDQFRWLHERTPPAGQVARSPMPWPEHLDDIAGNFVAAWVAVEESLQTESVVGSAFLETVGAGESLGPPIPPDFELTRPAVRLHRMRVAPERQRRRIGGQILKVAVRWATQQGFRSMILDTTPQQEPAVRFYRAFGFVERAHSKSGPYDLVWLEISLGRDRRANTDRLTRL